jgi:large subunit ribosomal protein L7/L12
MAGGDDVIMTNLTPEDVAQLSEADRNDFLRRAIEHMTIREVLDLVRELEERWDIRAVPDSGMMVPAYGIYLPDEPEDTEFDVVLREPGPAKIAAIKAIKTALGVSLHEGKTMVDTAGSIASRVSRKEADRVAALLEEAGAVVDVRPHSGT